MKVGRTAEPSNALGLRLLFLAPGVLEDDLFRAE